MSQTQFFQPYLERSPEREDAMHDAYTCGEQVNDRIAGIKQIHGSFFVEGRITSEERYRVWEMSVCLKTITPSQGPPVKART
ncbi:MAG: hypothetical protein JWO84_531 [Parcubacteria group bacterium]|nr:hypothetical protein [Parcubacteria group bacterium]